MKSKHQNPRSIIMCGRVSVGLGVVCLVSFLLTMGPQPTAGDLLLQKIQTRQDCLTPQQIEDAKCECQCDMLADIPSFCFPTSMKDYCHDFFIMSSGSSEEEDTDQCGCCIFNESLVC
ncbi:hypothetical protein Pmani_027236 [Petrolisthes manimaculis]|uniref:Uncharacterized protein n=1 Tax=Petrolisthes manimaculis TaxID=1843537 RepID=A0AAE1P4M0_9EUCA|nr:hypothetical protein Pmani_027236 [Petrolisthes manimaculis]